MKRALLLVLSLLPLVGCVTPDGGTDAEEVVSALKMRDEAMAVLVEEYPELKQDLEKSAGYGVFSILGIHPGLCSFANGYGVITNKKANRDTHSRWFRLTIGPGFAVKGVYAIAVFYDQEVLEAFEEGRWVAGGQAEAAFVFGDFGGAAELAWMFKKHVDVHYVTHTGVALELELIGIGNVSQEDDLNKAAAK